MHVHSANVVDRSAGQTLRKDCRAIHYDATRNFLENHLRLATPQPRRIGRRRRRLGCLFTMAVVVPIIRRYP
jgi:hypothetical protein